MFFLVVGLGWGDFRYVMYLAYYKCVTLCDILYTGASWQHEMFSILNQQLATSRYTGTESLRGAACDSQMSRAGLRCRCCSRMRIRSAWIDQGSDVETPNSRAIMHISAQVVFSGSGMPVLMRSSYFRNSGSPGIRTSSNPSAGGLLLR